MQGNRRKKMYQESQKTKYLAKKKINGEPKSNSTLKSEKTRPKKTPKMLVKTMLNNKCITIVYRIVEYQKGALEMDDVKVTMGGGWGGGGVFLLMLSRNKR